LHDLLQPEAVESVFICSQMQKAEALRGQAADDRQEGRIAELLLQLPDEAQD
jgi:hypothetical protein